jgi:hypothetical protein
MDRAETVRRAFEEALAAYWRRRGDAYLAGDELDEHFLEERWLHHAAPLPEVVAEARRFYFERFDATDSGTVSAVEITVDGRVAYAICTTTDGDDGWIEVFDEDGTALGAGRRYIELIDWGARDVIRGTTSTGAFPASLKDRMSRTLWMGYLKAKR